MNVGHPDLPRSAGLAAATAAAVLFCSLPFWTGPWLGMIDYPNHLARYFLLAHYEELYAARAFYIVNWTPVANIGLDAAVQAVYAATGLPVERISQVLVAAFSVLMIPAVLCLNRALFGAWSYWPLTTAVFVFNYVLIYGFTNYVAGLTLALFLAAAWVVLRERSLTLVLPAFAIASTTLFFFHLYVFCIYGLFVLCIEAWSLWKRQRGWFGQLLARTVASCLQFLPALLVLLLLSPTSNNIGLHRIRWSTPRDKLLGLYSVFDIGIPAISIVTFLAFGAIMLGGLLSRRLVLSGPGTLAVAALSLVFLAMPFTLLGSGFADFRLPIAITVFAIAATRWRALPKRAALLLSTAIVALVVVRVAAMTSEWAEGNDRYAAVMRSMTAMEPGRKLLTVIAEEDLSTRFLRRPPIDHAAGFAVLVRQAFVPTIFAEPEKQPIAFTSAVAPLVQWRDAIAPLYDSSQDSISAKAVAPYDYVLLFARTPLRRPVPAYLEQIDDGTVPDLALFAVRPPAGGGS